MNEDDLEKLQPIVNRLALLLTSKIEVPILFRSYAQKYIENILNSNILPMYERLSTCMSKVNEKLFVEFFVSLGKAVTHWDSAHCHGKKRLVQSYKEEIEKLQIICRDLFLSILFPNNQESILLPSSSLIPQFVLIKIQGQIYQSVSDTIDRGMDSLLSVESRAKWLQSLVHDMMGRVSLVIDIQLEEEKLAEDDVDIIKKEIEKIVSLLFPPKWQKALLLVPLRKYIQKAYGFVIQKIGDPEIQKRVFIETLDSFNYTTHVVEAQKPYNEEDEIEATVRLIEQPIILQKIVQLAVPFFDNRYVRAVQNFMTQKISEMALEFLNWEEDTPKMVRKVQRFILSDELEFFILDFFRKISAG